MRSSSVAIKVESSRGLLAALPDVLDEGFSADRCSGLPGKREDPHLAGMMPTTLIGFGVAGADSSVTRVRLVSLVLSGAASGVKVTR